MIAAQTYSQFIYLAAWLWDCMQAGIPIWAFSLVHCSVSSDETNDSHRITTNNESCTFMIKIYTY